LKKSFGAVTTARRRRASALGVLLLAVGARGPAAQEPVPDDDAVRRAWSYLTPEEQAEAVAWFELEVDVLGTFQNGCSAYAIEASEVDPGFWPVEEPRAWFDPAEHAPAQPIPRRRLEPDASPARRMTAEVAEVRPPRRLRSAWVYDWASGDVRRRGPRAGPAEVERVFANALAGFPPDADLAEALVLRALDTGEERVTLAAFAHAYTDRAGNVFPLSLYAAWSSGVEIEMPDVDTLGIAHDVLDEHRRWVAPVPTSKQKSLYKAIGERFADARRYRGLREALAACYVNADPVLWDGYGESLVRFHALWDAHASTPAKLAEDLPRDADDWTDYLAAWVKKVAKDRELRDRGLTRQATLAADAARVRARLVWVLEQLGAFERTKRPAPKEE
jgi:hypothetical protein